jgi:hypothetical protein
MAERMSDKAVHSKTGKTWPEWFAVLDKDDGKKMSHKEIVAVLGIKHGLGPWWQQMVTVEYERDRGLRQKYEMPDGFRIAKSLTVPVPVEMLYAAWKDGRQRKKWLDEAISIRTPIENRSLRADWSDGKSLLVVNFIGKSDVKSQVVLEHGKLPDAKTAERMKRYWTERFAALRSALGR